nr:MAG TPA: hypothetical protein [Caudoviricetes sp.]
MNRYFETLTTSFSGSCTRAILPSGTGASHSPSCLKGSISAFAARS